MKMTVYKIVKYENKHKSVFEFRRSWVQVLVLPFTRPTSQPCCEDGVLCAV